jgi:sugar phosphate permease
VGGVVLYGFTALIEPLAEEFGWSYAQISFAASLRGIETGILAPVVGFLVDRWGPRRLMFGGIIIVGLGLVLLSGINTLGMFWAAFGLIAAGVSTCSATLLMTAVSNWFHKKLGLASGIVLSGFGLSGLLVPLVVRVIDVTDWRTAMFIFGVAAWAIGLPLSLVFRRAPEQYGYLPDGEVAAVEGAESISAPVQFAEKDIGPRQFLRDRAFWHIGLALMLQVLVLMAVITHVMPYLSSINIERATAAFIASAIPLSSIGGRLSFGWFSGRFDNRRMAALGFAMMSAGMLLFSYAASVAMLALVPFFILFGIGYGSLTTMRVALVREYFGRKRFGTVHGFIIGIMSIGTIAGPPLAGWVFDSRGSYQSIWLIFAGLLLLALAIIAATPLSEGKGKSRLRSVIYLFML